MEFVVAPKTINMKPLDPKKAVGLLGLVPPTITATIIGAIALGTPLGLGVASRMAMAQVPQDASAITVRSDIQEANSETGVITARGNVQINYPARQIQATAAQAQYFTKERRLVLSGNVYVLQQGNSMRAETMTYLIDEGRFIATPKSSRQVESVYLVPESELSKKGN